MQISGVPTTLRELLKKLEPHLEKNGLRINWCYIGTIENFLGTSQLPVVLPKDQEIT